MFPQSFGGGGGGVFAPMSPRISSPARTDNPTGVGRGRGGRNQRDNEIIGKNINILIVAWFPPSQS